MSNKITILYLLDILKRKTDEQHPLTSSELINEIHEASHHQITIERKAIYRDIQTLIDYGHDILQTRENNRRGYYYANSDFEVAEIRLLMDAVEASSSISHKKSQQLIQKLSKLVNEHNEKDLQWQINYTSNKSENEHILYNVDTINQAIIHKQAITFQYYDYDLNHKRIARKKSYQGIPYALTWDQDKYYCVLYIEKYQTFSNYRLDKMDHIQAQETNHIPLPFDTKEHLKNTMGMYKGQKTTIQLQCANNQTLISHVFEKFGKDIMVQEVTNSHFTIAVPIEISPVFYGWLFQWTPQIRIVSPIDIKEHYHTMCSQALEKTK